MPRLKVVIIGGTNGFGKWLAQYLIENFIDKIELIITGLDKIQGLDVANQIGCIYLADNIFAVQNANIVIFAVPISITCHLMEQLCPHILSDTIICDVTSIKLGPTQAMEKFSPQNTLIIPTHPMFGPSIKSLAGQVIILTPNEKTKDTRNYILFKEYLIAQAVKIIEIEPAMHDNIMAVVQGMTHFNLFVAGATLKKLGFNFAYSQNFVSPVYKMLTALINRYMSQNLNLYTDIQFNNSLIPEVHEAYIQSALELQKYILNKDEKNFLNMLQDIKNYFGEWANEGQKYTDKLIFLNSRQIMLINTNLNRPVKIENIYTRANKTVVIIKFQNNKIYLESSEILDFNEWIII